MAGFFVFCNRRRTAVKILTYDGQGFWVCHKRLSQGKFPYWPTDGPIQELAAHQLQVLLMGADPQQGPRGVGLAAIAAGGLIEVARLAFHQRG